MSSIDGISSTTGGAGTTASPGLRGTKDEFLRLFMAQLQHQDPFAPTSGADMVGQLAQLSGVEQAKQTNDRLAELAAQQASAASAGLSSLVGRDCSAATGTFSYDGKGATPPIDVTSTSPLKNAAVVITDASGKEVRRIPVASGATSASAVWDGKDGAGNKVPAGNYTISVDAGASSSPVSGTWHGRVDAVELTTEGPRLRMGGLLLAPGDIRTIGATVAAISTPPTTPTQGTAT
ncbi:MAG: flagellar hook assembly protein FlgD [Deltaproteobacteria bacterium]|nr:flagellar hook assembly protein FlgD [Deltaproteobacteria bacterium]